MLKKIVIVIISILVVLALLTLFISVQPSEFKISRTAIIAAPTEVVFAEVNDLHKWQAWSPWAKLDPEAKNSFGEPSAGTGAIMSWSGNNKVGEGSMTIVESRPSEFIKFKLDFIKPMQGTNYSEFTFKPNDKNTEVTWSMYGTSDFTAKAISLIFNCEKIVGGQFEQGLASMKTILETPEK